MSQQTRRLNLDAMAVPVCEYCGGEIVEPRDRCPARDEGWCRP